MTGYGPPSNPPQGGYGQQPGYPPQGGYNQQPGYPPQGGYGYGPPRAGINFATINPLDWGILGGAVLALIFSFFEYYTADLTSAIKAQCQANGGGSQCDGDSAGAWHGFLGWFGVLLLLVGAIATAIAIFAPQASKPATMRLAGAGAAALGLICTFIALFVTPVPDEIDQQVDAANAQLAASGNPRRISADDLIDFGRGFSYWLILILSIAVVALSLLRITQTGGKLPGLGGARAGGYGAPPYGYGTPQGAPSYGTPPSYGAPQGPPQSPPAYGPPSQPYAQQPPPPQQAPPQPQQPHQQQPQPPAPSGPPSAPSPNQQAETQQVPLYPPPGQPGGPGGN